MSRSLRSLLVALALLVTLGCPSSAGAVSQCGPDTDSCKCGMNDPYPCCDNGGNCTWWAWEKACCNWSVGLPGWGNANQWSGNAKAHPNYQVLAKPVVGSVATRVSGSYGHVAWVTAVNGSKITVTQQNCWGGWGHETATFDASYFDGGFVVPKSQCECTPGSDQTDSCGDCGEKKRTCNSSCQWGSWGSCGGQGVCTPGDVQEKACGECGHHSHKCKADCSWGDFDTCDGLDPDATTECDTGALGACAVGSEQCVDGGIECVPTVEPSDEICDGIDNDCNGWIDDGKTCGLSDAGTPSSPKPAPDPQDTSSAQTTKTSKMEGGCALVPRAPGSSSGELILSCALLFGLLGRRRRRGRRIRGRMNACDADLSSQR